MEQDHRLSIVQSFKRGEFHFLVATDVAARGIHIDDVTHVFNYEVPMENESYVHRIGRTGRVENKGIAITLVSPRELRFLQDVEDYIQYKIPKRETPTDDEVQKGIEAFEDKIKSKPKAKKNKIESLNREITRIRINAGKTKRMRPGDILGAISNIKGVNPEDIGIIDVQDTCSYVEIFGRDADYIVKELQDTSIKGKVHTVKEVRFRNT
jgi:superfamily II DNA/RNA helicase